MLSPNQLDEREAAAPSELFTADPFKWDDADPTTQARSQLWPTKRSGAVLDMEHTLFVSFMILGCTWEHGYVQ